MPIFQPPQVTCSGIICSFFLIGPFISLCRLSLDFQSPKMVGLAWSANMAELNAGGKCDDAVNALLLVIIIVVVFVIVSIIIYHPRRQWKQLMQTKISTVMGSRRCVELEDVVEIHIVCVPSDLNLRQSPEASCFSPLPLVDCFFAVGGCLLDIFKASFIRSRLELTETF